MKKRTRKQIKEEIKDIKDDIRIWSNQIKDIPRALNMYKKQKANCESILEELKAELKEMK